MDPALRRRYAEAAPDLIERFERISSAALLAPIVQFIGPAPQSILDLGAGTGRDAAWLADKGHDVIAVEPVQELRLAGQACHPERQIRWIADSLPALATVERPNAGFDVILLSAVWHHLQTSEQVAAFQRCKALLAPEGRMILSLRDTPNQRRVPDARLRDQMAKAQMVVIHQVEAPSQDPVNARNGVQWAWIVAGSCPEQPQS